MNRKTFLKILASLGVLTFVPKTSGAKHQVKKTKALPSNKRILVIGAGLSGLEAASMLIQKGYDVEVIEADNRVGGRTLSSTEGNKRLDIGAQFISRQHENVLAYCEKFGLRLIPTSEKGRFLLVTSENTVHRIGTIPPINKITLGLNQALKEFDKISKRIDWNNTTKKNQQLGELDKFSVEDWIIDNIGNDEVKKLFRAAIAPVYSPSTTTHSLANAAFINYSNSSFRHLSNVKSGAQEYFLDNGTQQIAEGIASAFVDKISLNEKAVKIELLNNEFYITTNQKIRKVDYVICCLSPLHLKAIEFSSEIYKLIQHNVNFIATQKEVKIHLLYKHKFWEELRLSGSSLLSNGVIVSTIDGTPLNADYAVLTGFISSSFAETWFDKPKEERKEVIFNQLEAAFTSKIRDCIDLIESDWQNGCFHYYRKGYWTAITNQTDTAVPNAIQFAGTEFSTQFNGYMEGALLSGQKAAKKLLKHLRA